MKFEKLTVTAKKKVAKLCVSTGMLDRVNIVAEPHGFGFRVKVMNQDDPTPKGWSFLEVDPQDAVLWLT